MFPTRDSGRRRHAPLGRVLALTLVVVSLVAACSGPATASFDPASPCTTDGKMAGAYPDLEALVPKTFNGKAPTSLDSGRNCTTKNLGTLATHGVTEIRFAGGVWQDGPQAAITLAVFRTTGLQSDWLAEWYEASARAVNSTSGIAVSKPTIAGRPAQRLDAVNNDAAQSVITWPAKEPGTINVVLASDEPEATIQAAIAAFP